MANPRGFSQTGIELLYAELAKRGISRDAASGAIAGIMGESGANLDPTSFNTKDPGGGSGGIGQWNRTRLVGPNGLLSFAQNAGVPNLDTNTPTDAKKVPLATQVQYLGHELDTNYAGVRNQLQAAKSPQDALNIWVNSYENPLDKRAAIAQRSQYLAPVGTTLNSMPANVATGTTTGASAPAVTGTTGVSAPAAAAGYGNVLPGFSDTQAKGFLGHLSELDKASGGKGLPGYGGDESAPDTQQPAQMGPAPGARNVSPLLPFASSMGKALLQRGQTPPQWSGEAPGQNPYASAGLQQPYGTSLAGLQQLHMLTGMGDPFGADLGYFYGGG